MNAAASMRRASAGTEPANEEASVPTLPPELCRFRTFAMRGRQGQDEDDVYDLLRGRLRFKDIATFNDPFEARPAYVAAHADAGRQRRAMLTYLTEIAPVPGSRTQRRRWAEDTLRGQSMQDFIEKLGKDEDHWRRRGEIYLLCFSAVEAESTPLPWSHYADAHQGVSIRFDTTVLPLSLAVQVSYGDDYPKLVVPRTAVDPLDGIKNLLQRKCSLWTYEHEYRVVSLRLSAATEAHRLFVTWEGDVALAANRIARSITLGARMDDKPGNRLLNWVQENTPHVEVYKAKLHRSRYEVLRERIYAPQPPAPSPRLEAAAASHATK